LPLHVQLLRVLNRMHKPKPKHEDFHSRFSISLIYHPPNLKTQNQLEY